MFGGIIISDFDSLSSCLEDLIPALVSNDQLLIQNVSRPLLSPITEETASNKLDDIDYSPW